MKITRLLLVAVLSLAGALSVQAEQWQMNQKDIWHTGRADYWVPATRLNDTFFDTIVWQKATTGRSEGSSMVFYDGVGPDGSDIVCCGYSAGERCVVAVDRHTGAALWKGGPTAGTNIGKDTGAFSNDGSVFYVTTDNAVARCYAWATAVGPGLPTAPLWWDNGADTADPRTLSTRCPVIAPDGRIFLHWWNNKVFAGTDNGTSITTSWEAAVDYKNCFSDVSLYEDAGQLRVVTTGRGSHVAMFDGAAGTGGGQVWFYKTWQNTDATPTIDPDNGNIYVPVGLGGSTYIVGLDKDGNQLAGWSAVRVMVYEYLSGTNSPYETNSTGCLSHDGGTYYFQTDSDAGDGLLYAINTADGSVKWTYDTQAKTSSSDRSCSPIVTINGVIIVGDNDNGVYFAIKDGTADNPGVPTLIDTLETLEVSTDTYRANFSPTLSVDGLLYLPLRMIWSTTNGDGDVPTGAVANCLTAFSLSGCDPIEADLDGDCQVDLVDFGKLAGSWMDCGLQPRSDCD